MWDKVETLLGKRGSIGDKHATAAQDLLDKLSALRRKLTHRNCDWDEIAAAFPADWQRLHLIRTTHRHSLSSVAAYAGYRPPTAHSKAPASTVLRRAGLVF